MAVRIIADNHGAILYCSTDMQAFGPVFDDPYAAEDFLTWLPEDARTLSEGDLDDAYDRWHNLAYDRHGDFTGAGPS